MIEIPDYYTYEELLTGLNLSDRFRVTINNRIMDPETSDMNERIYGNYIIDIESVDKDIIKGIVKDARDVVVPENSDGETVIDDRGIMEDEDYEAFLDRRYGKNQYRSVKKEKPEENEGLGSFSSLSADQINAILAADRMETSLRYKELEKKSEELNRELEKIRQSNELARIKGQQLFEKEETAVKPVQAELLGQQTASTETESEVIIQRPKEIREIVISVNGTPVHMTGKAEYTFVNILDFYPFDTSSLKGTGIVQKVNGMNADFFTPVNDGDIVDLYWSTS